MSKRKLLIATSNPGKFKEMKEFFKTQPFEVVSLQDVGITESPEEPFDTVELNAYAKAKFYGEKSNMLTLADDGGLFIDALGGWPGVQAARVAPTDEEREKIVLEKMKDSENRKATVKGAWVLYEPIEKNFFTALGDVNIEIARSPASGTNGFGYDKIYFYSPLQKTFSEMSVEEKNSISHRGKGLNKIEYYLKKQYGARNIVVPCALVIQNGKMLMILRNDPHRPEYHRHWEFPGGSVEFREQMIPNVIRETEEETGLIVEPVQLLQHIATEAQEFPTFSYQVYLVPYVCKIVGGELNPHDQEALEARFFELDEVTQYPLVGENARLFEKLLPELREVIKEHNL